jgi:hypothetical protein
VHAFTGSGQVRGLLAESRDGQHVLAMLDVEALPPTELYQLWMLKPGTVASAGVFSGSGTILVVVPGQLRAWQLAAVSVEKAPYGASQPTRKPISVAPLS